MYPRVNSLGWRLAMGFQVGLGLLHFVLSTFGERENTYTALRDADRDNIIAFRKVTSNTAPWTLRAAGGGPHPLSLVSNASRPIGQRLARRRPR